MGFLLIIAAFAIAVIGTNVVFNRLRGSSSLMMDSLTPTPARRKDTSIEDHINRILDYIDAEEWNDNEKVEGRVIKLNPVLSRMLQDLDAIEHLEYIFPRYGIRVMALDSSDTKLRTSGYDHKVSFDGFEVGYKRNAS